MKSNQNQSPMSESIYNLIQEKRKLFYTGVIRNKYKKQENNEVQVKVKQEDPAAYDTKGRTFKSRSLNILQEIFSD
jgi:CRISPR/Cas system CSM-associated protein Csm2 small subunit